MGETDPDLYDIRSGQPNPLVYDPAPPMGWPNSEVLNGRVLPFDLPAARTLATYPVPDRAPLDDALIAAVTQSTGMTIATRNTRHFQPLGVSIVNPWSHPE